MGRPTVLVRTADLGGRIWLSLGQGADLDQAVGNDSVYAPGTSSGQCGQFGTVPFIAAFEVVDPSFACGSPFDLGAERFPMFELPPGNARSAGAWDGHTAHPELMMQIGLHRGVSVAAVSSHRRGSTPGPVADTATATPVG